ncbi:hypothetical protein XELAEV_18006734mg [Xenopus laevis]|uniref:GIY-YIG domain-containing protein n=1 Tax=Xenopus laevis TaxID=8355 RepID=A0A974I4G4_XENLA|nr:hypothetical protein XELAEV_18006734mg [Xenopus laevis]
MLIWQGSEQLLKEFVSQLNINTFNLIFTLNFDRCSLEFLDILITKDNGGLLSTNLYRKKTASNSLLHASSMHPHKCIDGIPKGQYLRLRRICSSDESFKQEAHKLYQRFKARGYKTRCLNKAYQNAFRQNREELLYQTHKVGTPRGKSKKQNETRLIMTFSENDKEIRSIIEKHWNILSKNPSLGTFRCGTCEQCSHLKISTTFGRGTSTFDMYQYICCTTTHVVYLFTCHCGSKYVGKTTRPLKRRIYEHLRDVKNCNLMSSIAKHIYCLHDGKYAGSYFQGIDCLHGDIRGGDLDKKLLQLETMWIFRLNTYKSNFGLNGHLNFQAFINT